VSLVSEERDVHGIELRLPTETDIFISSNPSKTTMAAKA